MGVHSTWKVTVFLEVAVLFFLYLARLGFPKNESISSIVCKIYSGEFLKASCKFENLKAKLVF